MSISIKEISAPNFIRPLHLLHGHIPRGLEKFNPRTILGKEWWDDVRKEAERENNYCCHACGKHKSEAEKKWLEGHEAYSYDFKKRVATYEGTVSLCTTCHMFIHSGLTLTRAVGSDISQRRFVEVMTHGVKVLAQVGLDPYYDQILTMYAMLSNREIESRTSFLLMELLLGISVATHVGAILRFFEMQQYPRVGHWTLMIDGKAYYP